VYRPVSLGILLGVLTTHSNILSREYFCWRVGFPVCCSPLVVCCFPPCGVSPRGVRGLCPLRSFDPAHSFAFMGPHADPSGVGTPDSGWQQSGRRGRAAAARVSTTSAETPAGTQASLQQLLSWTAPRSKCKASNKKRSD